MRWGVFVVLGLFAGCNCVSPDDRIYACENTRCPSGLACIDGYCLLPDGGGGVGGGGVGGGGVGGGGVGGGGVGGGGVGGGGVGGGGVGGGGAGGGTSDAGTDAGVDAGPPPPNDFCANAIALTLVDGGATVFGDLTRAKSDSSQCSSTGPDVYYTFFGRSPITAQVILLDGGTWTPHVMIKDSCAVSYLACAQNQTLNYTTGKPDQYWIQVDSAMAGAGPFQLNVTALDITPGDQCANIITAALGANPATTAGSVRDDNLSCSPWIADTNEVFFGFQIPDGGLDAGTLTATIFADAGRELVVSIRPGSACPGSGSGTGATCGNNSSAPNATAVVPATPGPYVIVVGDRDTAGPFTLVLSSP